MSLSLYEAVVLPMQQTVGSVQSVLEKGAQHYESRGLNPDELLGESIHSDMFPLTFQLHSVIHHSPDPCRSGHGPSPLSCLPARRYRLCTPHCLRLGRSKRADPGTWRTFSSSSRYLQLSARQSRNCAFRRSRC